MSFLELMLGILIGVISVAMLIALYFMFQFLKHLFRD